VPDKVRADPTFQHEHYASMQRKCPPNPNPYVLYLDTSKYEGICCTDAINAVFRTCLMDAVAITPYAASRVLAVAFDTVENVQKYAGKPLKDFPDDVCFYANVAPSTRLLRYTVNGVPSTDRDATSTALIKEFQKYGEVVEVCPLKYTNAPYLTGTWHITVRADIEDEARSVPSTLQVLDSETCVDIPGQRRVCPICKSEDHIDPRCKTGQRQRQRFINPHRDSAPVLSPRNPLLNESLAQLRERERKQAERRAANKAAARSGTTNGSTDWADDIPEEDMAVDGTNNSNRTRQHPGSSWTTVGKNGRPNRNRSRSPNRSRSGWEN
jgi:hypothetical protein